MSDTGAHHLAMELCGYIVDTLTGQRRATPAEANAHVLGMIEADRNAVRLALLDELIALDDGSTETMPVYRAVAVLRAKYSGGG